MVPRLFLRFVLLLLGSFYLGSVCELDAAERGQHYAQETHGRRRVGSPAAWSWVANPPPPVRRLYLRYAVLQV